MPLRAITGSILAVVAVWVNYVPATQHIFWPNTPGFIEWGSSFALWLVLCTVAWSAWSIVMPRSAIFRDAIEAWVLEDMAASYYARKAEDPSWRGRILGPNNWWTPTRAAPSFTAQLQFWEFWELWGVRRQLQLPAIIDELDGTRLFNSIRAAADVDGREGGRCTALMWAALTNNVHLARVLLQRGASVNLGSGEHPMTRNCIAPTALGLACVEGSVDIAGMLLQCGAEMVPEQGNPVLICATRCNQGNGAALVDLMLAHKADINIQSEHFLQTALISAVDQMNFTDSSDVVRKLLDAGADPHIQNKAGRTALITGCQLVRLVPGSACIISERIFTEDIQTVREGLVSKLIQCSAGCIDAQTHETGRTALCSAAINGQVAMVADLLRCDANPNIRDREAKTALDHVRQILVQDEWQQGDSHFPTEREWYERIEQLLCEPAVPSDVAKIISDAVLIRGQLSKKSPLRKDLNLIVHVRDEDPHAKGFNRFVDEGARAMEVAIERARRELDSGAGASGTL